MFNNIRLNYHSFMYGFWHRLAEKNREDVDLYLICSNYSMKHAIKLARIIRNRVTTKTASTN